jgi:hypothetical protein
LVLEPKIVLPGYQKSYSRISKRKSYRRDSEMRSCLTFVLNFKVKPRLIVDFGLKIVDFGLKSVVAIEFILIMNDCYNKFYENHS